MAWRWITKAESALNDLVEKAVLFGWTASDKRKKEIGPGKFIEKFATEEQKEALKDLKSDN